MSGERRIFVLLNGSHGVGKRAVSRVLIRMSGAGVALDGYSLLQVHPPPATPEEGVARLAQILPPLIETHAAAGAHVFVLAHACETGAQVRALRACVRPLVSETAAYRLICTPTSIRTRMLGVNAGKRFELWRRLHDRQEAGARKGDLGWPMLASDGDVVRIASEIWADRNRSVEIADPDPTWAQTFEQEHARITKTLGDRLLQVHHVGSTSVRGLPAKPIIDMMAEVVSLAEARHLTGPLYDLGYVFNDHPENTDRLIFTLRGDPKVHLHVVERESVELLRHLAFRDALREDADLRKRYADLKRRLAREHPGNRQGYSDAKTAFIRAAEEKLGFETV